MTLNRTHLFSQAEADRGFSVEEGVPTYHIAKFPENRMKSMKL